MHKHTAKEYHIFDLVYRINIVLVVGCREASTKLIKEIYEVDFDLNIDEGAPGYTEMLNGNIFVWLGKFDNTPDSYSNFTHEMFHAMTYALDSRGVKFSVHNDEPHAYYLGFLIREFLTKLKAK